MSPGRQTPLPAGRSRHDRRCARPVASDSGPARRRASEQRTSRRCGRVWWRTWRQVFLPTRRTCRRASPRPVRSPLGGLARDSVAADRVAIRHATVDRSLPRRLPLRKRRSWRGENVWLVAGGRRGRAGRRKQSDREGQGKRKRQRRDRSQASAERYSLSLRLLPAPAELAVGLAVPMFRFRYGRKSADSPPPDCSL